jgi:hypothetical protein
MAKKRTRGVVEVFTFLVFLMKDKYLWFKRGKLKVKGGTDHEPTGNL